ncbi:SDR family NAD(P)-dependent oxidoreductase [Pelagicoccus albus]|uniref:SDR family NAD(P)-dependent oxidoreductase n=1 Tax=Pelagicoccus albus TaxID=415222 RepID=A0A7X1B2Z5_9BACT|nr:SDR family NAD(P)-dependent oxidoreductase [Pelagicoccus albus]MBC2604706.1 SDR family NAD(P)-dependent oxidoreductase [Pelagicoccus albus]
MRTIFITGVSRGLGRALAQTLSDENTRIVGFGRGQGDFQGIFHSCDFTKPQLADSIIDTALAEEDLQSSDSIIFIANAGRLGQLNTAQNLDAFDIEQTIATNLSGSAVAASAFLRHTQDLDVPKVFVQISSGAALPEKAKASWSLYCASKAGQEQLVRTIAAEQATAKYPATFINLNPGVMETSMQEQIRNVPPEVFPDVARFIKLKEDGLVPGPEAVAQKIKDLLSDATTLKNGETYSVA